MWIHVKILKSMEESPTFRKVNVKKRMNRLVRTFQEGELNDAMEGLQLLANREYQVGAIPGYRGFVSSMAINNYTPLQNVLALAHLKNEGLIDKVVGFEQRADFDSLQLGRIKIPWEKGRRWDVMVDPDKMLEVKGSLGDLDQALDGRFEREFKNDVLHNLFRINTPPSEFEYIIKTEGGKQRYIKAMEKMLGKVGKNGEPLGSLDKGLKSVMKKMAKDDVRYQLALDRLERLRDKLLNDELVSVGSVTR